MPRWRVLVSCYGREWVWAFSRPIGGHVGTGFELLTAGPWALPISYILFPFIVLAIIFSVIVYTMSSDIVDYGRFHTGVDHGGLYGSLFTFLQKSLTGVSEEHTSELQSLMRISYAVFCLKKKTKRNRIKKHKHI